MFSLGFPPEPTLKNQFSVPSLHCHIMSAICDFPFHSFSFRLKFFILYSFHFILATVNFTFIASPFSPCNVSLFLNFSFLFPILILHLLPLFQYSIFPLLLPQFLPNYYLVFFLLLPSSSFPAPTWFGSSSDRVRVLSTLPSVFIPASTLA